MNHEKRNKHMTLDDRTKVNQEYHSFPYADTFHVNTMPVLH